MMLPRRSLRIHQLNNRPASTVIASSSSVNATSKSTGNAAKKRTHTKIMAEADASVNDVTVQPEPKKMKFNNDNNDPIGPFLSLPAEVLEQIFIKVDDFGLSNFADTCTRFESIALTVASKRYADEYFVINSERLGGDREIYEAIFNRFGIYIDAIEINHIKNITAKHWLTKMLRPHFNHITKLAFNTCDIVEHSVFSQIMHKITHLAMVVEDESLVYVPEIDLCRKLVRLDARGVCVEHLKDWEEIIRNNPGLQSILGGFDVKVFQENSISDHLDQLKEVDNVHLHNVTDMKVMDGIIHTLRNLESLGLHFHSRYTELIQRLGSECKRIKRLTLGLDYDFRWDDRTIGAVRSFQQIEYLQLSGVGDQIDETEMVVKCLPNLRHLRFDVRDFADFPFADILPLLCECTTLQTINVSLKDVHLNLICTQFFNDFLETIAAIGNSNARIEIENYGKVVATMNRYGIVCRSKLIHWISCDNIPESSDTHLLKLGKELVKSDMGREQSQETVQQHLLDRIFDYLDITSLYLFAETSSGCKQLVENHIKMHSKQNGLFTMTDEFYPLVENEIMCFDGCSKMHQMFAPHVTNLKIHIFVGCNDFDDYLENYAYLKKVSIYDEMTIRWHFPKSLRHVILDGSKFIDSSELCESLGGHKRIDTLELRNASSFNDLNKKHKNLDGILKDTRLERLIFNYRGETQLNNLKKMFNGSKTKLVPISPNFNHF